MSLQGLSHRIYGGEGDLALCIAAATSCSDGGTFRDVEQYALCALRKKERRKNYIVDKVFMCFFMFVFAYRCYYREKK